MSEQIKRIDAFGCEGPTAPFVWYSDHLAALEAARAEDKAVIDRLQSALEAADLVSAELVKGIENRMAEIERLREQVNRLLGADAQWDYAKLWRDRAETAQARIKQYRARLEVDHYWLANEAGDLVRVECAEDQRIDGIECRDETIKLLEARVAELEAKVKQPDSLVNDDEAVRRDALLKLISLKFRSGNSIPVDRITLTRGEVGAIFSTAKEDS
jgi:hypothetical protein